MSLSTIARELSRSLSGLRFGPPVSHVYDPLDYAWKAHRVYLERWGKGTKEVVLLGMNPGPWGMVQTGVPFGEVSIVRDWLGIDAPIGRPLREHPSRPVLGFACPRSEVSGARFWGWAREVFGTPERFFGRFFVANWCPLAFLEPSGRNLTPDKLPAQKRALLEERCDLALRRTVDVLSPRFVVGVGDYAYRRAQRALEGFDVRVGKILHPSPASPAANRNWAERATAEMRSNGIDI